jgi:hypothetical protein
MAKRNKELDQNIKKVEKPLSRLNGIFSDLVDNLSSSRTSIRDRDLQQINKEVDDVVYNEIEGLTKFTGDDISVFLVKLFNDQESESNMSIKGIEDIFENEQSGMFTFFQERYRNQNLLFEDLNVISTQLYELKEALLATRDAIVTSDELSNSVSRTLSFKNSSDDDTNKKSYTGIIEDMEAKYKLLDKIKSHVVPNTLLYGRYYVYSVPYSELFQKHHERQEKDKQGLRTATLESAVDDAFARNFREEMSLDISAASNSKIKESFKEVIENVEVYNNELDAVSVMEGISIDDIFDAKMMKQASKLEKKATTQPETAFQTDGTVDVDVNGKKKTSKKDGDYSNIKDCYVKLIDPRKVIPIKIMDEVIGYYYIQEVEMQAAKSPFTTNIKLTPGNNNVKDIESGFLSKITDKIVKGFDKPFLEKNIKFKELILNSLMYNDIYKKKLKFQFIPVDYMTEFTVNENEDGEGTSILYPSLFYSKLYLALLLFKMISIISKSNDQKVYYVRQSGIDNDVANKVQNVARSIKEGQINFMDLMNYNSMVTKVGKNKEIFMPIGRSGEKGIDFDVIAGQDVQLNTELMEMLRTSFINATGVPSVIMNYVNEADYAKTLVMANAKFMGRIVSYQLNFNSGLTELYRKIMKHSTDIPEEYIDEFLFKLSAPRALDSMNMTDLINNTDQVLMYLIKTVTGENADQSDDNNQLKDLLYEKFSKEFMPMLPWDKIEEMTKEAKVELAKKKTDKKAKGSGEDTDM